MAASVELGPWSSVVYAPGPNDTEGDAAASASANYGSVTETTAGGSGGNMLHDKKAARATVRDEEAALNEPDENLTLRGIFRRGWFLFTFQSGKQLLAAFLGGLPLALLFALALTLPDMLPEGYGHLWIITFIVFEAAFILYLPSLGGAITCLTGAAHVGDRISIATAYRRTWAHYGRLLLAFSGVYMGTVLGLCLFIVPGIWFLSRYGLAWVIVPLEKCTVSEAFARSAQLQNGRGTVALAIHGIMGLLNTLVVVAFVVVMVFLYPALEASVALNFFVLFLYMLLLLLSTAPYIPMLTAFYYDCIRRLRLQQPGSVNP